MRRHDNGEHLERTTPKKRWLAPGAVIPLSQGCAWVFSVLIVAVTPPLLATVDSLGEQAVRMLQDRSLRTEDIVQVVDIVRRAWLTALFGYLVLVVGGLVLALWAALSARWRIRQLTATMNALGTGGEVPIPERRASDVIGTLEEATARAARRYGRALERARHHTELQQLGMQFQRAVDYVDNEQEVIEAVDLALQRILGDERVEILLADSSHAHLRLVSACAHQPERMCPVQRPSECAAVRRGATLVFPDSRALDACPRLRKHDAHPCSATCTPMNVMGRTIGVLHVVGPPGTHLHDDQVRMIELIAAQTGARMGVLRTLASSQVAATTDPLTGLLNRRSFEERATALLAESPDAVHAIVVADLDHFKRLNDTAGHAAGDRALRAFARVLTSTLRDRDLVGRHGGEEFVVLLRDCNEQQARQVLSVVQANLRAEVARAGLPEVTASFGVAPLSGPAANLHGAIAEADRAMYAAKQRGRNCIVTASELSARADTTPASQATPPREATPPARRDRRHDGTRHDEATTAPPASA